MNLIVMPDPQSYPPPSRDLQGSQANPQRHQRVPRQVLHRGRGEEGLRRRVEAIAGEEETSRGIHLPRRLGSGGRPLLGVGGRVRGGRVSFC